MITVRELLTRADELKAMGDAKEKELKALRAEEEAQRRRARLICQHRREDGVSAVLEGFLFGYCSICGETTT